MSGLAPQIIAKFVTEEGKPSFIDTVQVRHYRIQFEIQNPPENTYAVTFELDPTYYDPIRTIRVLPDKPIIFETTSYGEYEVKVRLRTKDGEILISRSLVEALVSGAGDNPTEAEAEAIHRIRAN